MQGSFLCNAMQNRMNIDVSLNRENEASKYGLRRRIQMNKVIRTGEDEQDRYFSSSHKRFSAFSSFIIRLMIVGERLLRKRTFASKALELVSAI